MTGVTVSGPLASEEVDLLVHAAVAGLGILHVTDWYVANELASGKLVEVLSHYPIVDKGAVYHNARCRRDAEQNPGIFRLAGERAFKLEVAKTSIAI